MSDKDLPPINIVGPDAAETGWVTEVSVSKERVRAIREALDSGQTFDSQEELDAFLRRKEKSGKNKE